MKKLLLMLCLFAPCLSGNAQIQHLLEMGLKYDPNWVSDSLKKYHYTNFFFNNSTQKRDSSTLEIRIFWNNGRIDSIEGGYHLVFSNDTLHIDTVILMAKTRSLLLGDSSVYVDYDLNKGVEKPNYRLTTVKSGGKLMHYYREYYQTGMGWDGQYNRFDCKYDSLGRYMGSDEYFKGATGPYTLRTYLKRTYAGNQLQSDSAFRGGTFSGGLYTYETPLRIRISGFNTLGIMPSYAYADFDTYGKIKTYIQYQSLDTPVVRLTFFNGAGGTNSVQEMKEDTRLSVYPNPVQDILNISGLTVGKGQVTLFDVTGNSVKKIQMDFSQENTIDISGLLPGMYVLQIQMEGKFQYVRILRN